VQFKKQLADDKLKFYTSISHEFKTHLALILGPVEDLLASRALSPVAENLFIKHLYFEKRQYLGSAGFQAAV